MITSFKKTSKLKNKKKRSKLQDHHYTSIWTNDGYPNYETIVVAIFEQTVVIQLTRPSLQPTVEQTIVIQITRPSL